MHMIIHTQTSADLFLYGSVLMSRLLNLFAKQTSLTLCGVIFTLLLLLFFIPFFSPSVSLTGPL